MRPPQTTVINGWTYEVRPLPAGQGLHLLTRLTRILGAGAVGVASTGSVARAVEGVLERAEPDAVVAIARELAASATISQPGAKAPAKLDEVFDVHFAGDYEPMFAFLRFAMEVNFRPFVEGLARRAATSIAALAVALKKPDAAPSAAPAEA